MSNTPIVKASVLKEKVRLWDNYTVIGEVQKTDQQKYVVGAGVRDGVRYINIREFYYRKRDGTWNHGKNGVAIPLRVPIEKGTKLITPYLELTELLSQAAEALETMPLSDPQNAVYIERKQDE